MTGTKDSFVGKLRESSSEELLRKRRKLLFDSRCCQFGVVLVLVAMALVAAEGETKALALLAALVALNIGLGMHLQTRIWFTDLVLGERAEADKQ